MPRYPLHLASGTGIISNWRKKVIRFARYGCTNRPFYHIVIIDSNAKPRDPPIEQLGTYDPMENQYNERLIALNFERIQFWMGQENVEVSKPVAGLLGLSGFLPIHPITYIQAWTYRKKAEQEAKAKEEAEAKENTQKAEQSN